MAKKFVVLLVLLPFSVLSLKYPNEIVDTPVVLCEPERIVIKVRTTSSNPSHIYVEDHGEDPDCSSRNMNKVAIQHGKCGMALEKTENPAGVIQRICVSVQLHPLFVTESDRTYCAQCVYVESHVLDDFEQTLDISEAPPTDLAPQFDFNDAPKCSYTIRKGSENGPEVKFATVGDNVFHVWHCDSENTGILVQNCHVEDGQGNKILIVDEHGCGVDHYVMPTPQYSNDVNTAFQETHVFKFAQKTITRFVCQIRICLKGEECKKLSPPASCPTLDQRLAAAKRLRDAPQKGIKEVIESKSTEKKILENATSEKPKNSTLGSIYLGYGFGGSRNRRAAHSVTDDSRLPRFSVAKGYPEVDLVGELRVLDNEEDVQLYEQLSAGSTCVTPFTYYFLVGCFSLSSLLLILLIGILYFRSSKSNKILRFVH